MPHLGNASPDFGPSSGSATALPPHLSRLATTAGPNTDTIATAGTAVALQGWHTFREGADPKRWLFAVCHHTFLHTIRHESRYIEAPYDDPELDSLATARAHWEAQQSGVAELVERMDLAPAIDRALATLPAYFRGAVVLVDVEGESYEEAAEILRVAAGTVRSRLFRGRRLLQDMLFEYARDAGFETACPSSAPTEPTATSAPVAPHSSDMESR